MASSIIGGLVANGHPPSKIHASDPYPPSLDKLKEVAAVNVSDTNAAAVEGADVIILAVKPQVMAEAVESIAGAAKAAGALTLSIAAGVTIESMQQRLGDQADRKSVV